MEGCILDPGYSPGSRPVLSLGSAHSPPCQALNWAPRHSDKQRRIRQEPLVCSGAEGWAPHTLNLLLSVFPHQTRDKSLTLVCCVSSERGSTWDRRRFQPRPIPKAPISSPPSQSWVTGLWAPRKPLCKLFVWQFSFSKSLCRIIWLALQAGLQPPPLSIHLGSLEAPVCGGRHLVPLSLQVSSHWR